MWWKPPRVPVTDNDKTWVERSLLWCLDEFGADYVKTAPMYLPTPQFFPDPYRGTPECARLLLDRVCRYMHIASDLVALEIYDDHQRDLDDVAPLLSRGHAGPAGLYLEAETTYDQHTVAIEIQQLRDPTSLVATMAHEVGHVILLGQHHIEADAYHEYLTDLFTVFCGFGLISANSARTFRQYTCGDGLQGWSSSRKGYLSQQVYGYALACWTYLRNDLKPAWARQLSTNVKCDFDASLKYLLKTGDTTLVKVW